MDDSLYDLLISYRSGDLAAAEQLYRRLVQEAFRVWFDKRELDPGSNWYAEIEAGCESSRGVLPVITPRWQESEWTRYETYGAELVIPLLYEGEWQDVLPPPLKAFQGLDLRNSDEAVWQDLFATIRRLLQQEPPNRVERLFYVPYASNPHFIGREKLLLEIHEKLWPAPSTGWAASHPFVVAGLGGIGKTTVVREYVEKFWRLYRQILWVHAEDATAMCGEFARLALEMRLVEKPSPDAIVDAHRALRALEGSDQRLLILDNVQDEASVEKWLPKAGGCRTIITSRFAAWSAAVHSIRVIVLEPEPARDFLVERSGRPRDEANLQAAARLAEELGYLPLALEQAAAYIALSQDTFGRYLERYTTSQQTVLGRRVLGGSQYPKSVATTWLTTLERLSPLARAVLCLVSFLGPDDILKEMVCEGGGSLTAALQTLSDGDVQTPSPEDIEAALMELASYCLVFMGEDAFSVHRLVQAVGREIVPPGERRRWAAWAMELADAKYPAPDFANWPLCDRMLPHARACVEHLTGDPVSPAGWRLANWAGLYLHERGQYASAEPLYRHAVAASRAALGEADAEFARVLNNLGELYYDMRDYGAAEPLLRRHVAIMRDAVGEHHPFYALALNNLAELHRACGDYTAAEPLLAQAVDIYRRTLGEIHPYYGQSLSNLAQLHFLTHRYESAEAMLLQALEVRRQALGVRHPHVARTLSVLAALMAATGRHESAEKLYHEVLDIRRESLGAGSPGAAETLHALGTLHQATGALRNAEDELRQSWQIRRELLGEGHPDSVAVRDDLIALLRATGRGAEAEALGEQV